jgi:hypothetical protein
MSNLDKLSGLSPSEILRAACGELNDALTTAFAAKGKTWADSAVAGNDSSSTLLCWLDGVNVVLTFDVARDGRVYVRVGDYGTSRSKPIYRTVKGWPVDNVSAAIVEAVREYTRWVAATEATGAADRLRAALDLSPGKIRVEGDAIRGLQVACTHLTEEQATKIAQHAVKVVKGEAEDRDEVTRLRAALEVWRDVADMYRDALSPDNAAEGKDWPAMKTAQEAHCAALVGR